MKTWAKFFALEIQFYSNFVFYDSNWLVKLIYKKFTVLLVIYVMIYFNALWIDWSVFP